MTEVIQKGLCMMQGAPGVGRGMTVDFSDEVPVPSSQHTQSPYQNPNRSDFVVTAESGPDFMHNEQGQRRADTMESPSSLFQEVQRRQRLQEMQKKQSEVVGWAPLNQFDTSPGRRQPSLPSMDSEKQWFIKFGHHQQQQQQQQQQQMKPFQMKQQHAPPPTMAASPRQQPQQQHSLVPAPAVSPQQQRIPQVQILKHSPQPTQAFQPAPYPGQPPLQQQQASPPLQELRQRRRDQAQPPLKQNAFPSSFSPPFLPPSASPPFLDPISMLPIDTSKPPPPLGVPLPRLPFSPSMPPPVRFSPHNAVPQPALRPPSIPQQPFQPSAYLPPNTQPAAESRHQPEKSKAMNSMGGDGSAFTCTTMPDSVWDSMPLGGGYTPLEAGVKPSSPAPQPFLPRAGDGPSQAAGQGGLTQMDQYQPKGSYKQNRDGLQPQQKPWNRKDRAKGRGMPKKDSQSAGTPPASKPGGPHTAPLPTKQPQDNPQALSQEQAKNEYEWQSFKIVRKVRKVLGGLKEKQDAGKAAVEINDIMKAESGRLACFPWPKEQFVALDEVLGWAMERPETVDVVCKLIQELQGQHPENFAEDLTNTFMKRHTQYIKVSTATNKEKMYATFSGLLANLFVLSCSAKNDFRQIVDKLVDVIVNKWIVCDTQDTAEDPSMLAEVYACCLRALVVIIGPQLDEQKDEKYNKLLRDQVLGNQPRYVKEAMLDLLLLRAVDWKWSAEFKTESASDSKKEAADDSESRPETDESRTRVDGERAPENDPEDRQTDMGDHLEGSHLAGGDASSSLPSRAPETEPEATAKEIPSQTVILDASRLDQGKTQSPSPASDAASAVPPENSSCQGQNASEHQDAGIVETQAEQASFNFHSGSTANFKLPDRETSERGALVLNPTPWQVPCFPASTDSFTAPSQQITPNNWSPVYLKWPQETTASNEDGSQGNPKFSPSEQTNTTKWTETTQDLQHRTANGASNGSVDDSSPEAFQSKAITTTVGPAELLPNQDSITGE